MVSYANHCNPVGFNYELLEINVLCWFENEVETYLIRLLLEMLIGELTFTFKSFEVYQKVVT